MDFNDLNQETQLFLRKAMDIYAIITHKTLNTTVKGLIDTKNYEFTKLDKKVLSLFIAGFLFDGNLKELFSQYDDIKLNNLYEFAGIKTKNIPAFTDEKYDEYFEKHFQLDLIHIIRERNFDKSINTITPEVIVNSLQYIHLSGSHILNYFAKKYEITNSLYGFNTHPIFRALENFNLMEGSISKKDSSNKNNTGIGLPSTSSSPAKKTVLKPDFQSQAEPKTTKLDDKVWQLLDNIKKKFIGQERATENIFYNIINNQQLAQIDDLADGERSIMFIDGPTGTGKTAITREITEQLGLPFTTSSVTNYSSTGYVGGDITDVLKELYKKADGNIEKAQRGIVVFDEFDKITYSKNNGLEMKKAVQQQMLDFLGGGKYKIRVTNNLNSTSEIGFDTSKLTFVCLGALTDLISKKTEKKNNIGFNQTNQIIEDNNYSINPQDLIDIGLERELVGRFNTFLHTNDYSKEALKKILTESSISPLIGFKKWIEAQGKQLVIDEKVYDLITEYAYELNTGARSLQTVMNNIRTMFIKEVLRGTSQTIHLDSESVIKANEQTVYRKTRG